MTIKHMPSGLFPHFDSGLERTPFFVREGDAINFGCRLDDSSATAVHMEVTDQAGTHIISGKQVSQNDRNQRYFRFDFEPLPGTKTLTYRFVASNEKVSQWYSCPILKEVTLDPTSETHLDGINWLYKTDTAEYEIKILAAHSIRVIFTQRTNVKTIKIKDNINFFEKDPESRGQMVDIEGMFRISPSLTLMLDENGGVHNLRLRFSLPGYAVYGMGEKFDAVNQIGKQPLNYVVEQFANQENKTYLPIPFAFTDSGVSFLQKTSYPSSFRFSKGECPGYIDFDLFACCPREGVLYEAVLHKGAPDRLLQCYAEETGHATLPPEWAFGPWMSSNGWNTQKEALEQVHQMHDTGIPATVMVLEAWSDEETFYIWNDAKYEPRKDGGEWHYADFTFLPDGKWPDPMQFCHTLSDNGLKLVLWQIPVIKYEAAVHGIQLDLDWEYAQQNALCLRNADGSPYHITEMWFGNSLIPDFTNPKTREWWFNCRKYLVEELGVAGFKTDGGEFLFDPDAFFSDGRTVLEAHNEFPNMYESAYHELLSSCGGITFSRAGYTGAQRYPIHWAGDQVSTFSELKGQLTAGLSLGLSGVPFWGFDIGGFAGDFPTTELYLRSAAFAAFAPIMQFHSEPRGGQYYMVERNHWNNDRSPWNMAIANKDNTIVPVYRLFANLRMNLLPYIWQEAQYSSNNARPLMAHLIYEYPYDAHVQNIEDEYMFGRDMLVAPVIVEGATSREIYLPDGRWYDLWTGQLYDGLQTIRYVCPIDQIPVFVRDGAAIPVNLNNHLCMGSKELDGAISNQLGHYGNLCILLYGSTGQKEFVDDKGTNISIKWDKEDETVCGTTATPITIFRMDGNSHGEQKGSFFGRIVCGVRREHV